MASLAPYSATSSARVGLWVSAVCISAAVDVIHAAGACQYRHRGSCAVDRRRWSPAKRFRFRSTCTYPHGSLRAAATYLTRDRIGQRVLRTERVPASCNPVLVAALLNSSFRKDIADACASRTSAPLRPGSIADIVIAQGALRDAERERRADAGPPDFRSRLRSAGTKSGRGSPPSRCRYARDAVG